MVRMLDLVAQVAPSRSTILITGETGTGKEWSPKPSMPIRRAPTSVCRGE